MIFSKKRFFTFIVTAFVCSTSVYSSMDSDADIAYSTLLGSHATKLSRSITDQFLEDFSIADLRTSIDHSKIESFAPIILSGSPGSEVCNLLNRTLSSFGSEVRVISLLTDESQYTHILLQQYYQGFLVEGASMGVHCDQNNQIYYVVGSILRKAIPSLHKTLSSASAQNAAVASILRATPNQTAYAEDTPELVVFHGQLCYKIYISYRDAVPARYTCYIDATSGELLFAYNNPYTISLSRNYSNMNAMASESNNALSSAVKVKGIRLPKEGGNEVSFDVTQSFALKNDTEKWSVYDCKAAQGSSIPKSSASLITNTSADWGNTCPYGISAALNVSISQKKLKEIWGFNSWNNQGGAIAVYVNWGMTNAMFDGSAVGFGNGKDNNPIVPMDHSCVLDVMAHEIGHGISQFIGVSFTYQGESGTFSETFSDITAMTVEFAAQPADTAIYPKTKPGCADWLMGEDAIKYKAAGESDDLMRGRDMRNPWRSMRLEKYEGKSQPKYYKGKEWISSTADQGGVHVNAGVPCFAHYLLAMGTNNANAANDPQGQGKNGEYIDEKGAVHYLKGIGIFEAAKLSMTVNSKKLLTSSSTQSAARNAWLAAAKQVGFGALEVEAAFSAVGLGGQTRSLKLSDSVIDFGSVAVGKTQNDTILCANPDGKEATILYAITISDSTQNFSSSTKCPLIISGANSEKAIFSFTPKKAGTYQTKVTIRSNATEASQREVTITLKAVAEGSTALNTSNFTSKKNGFVITPNPVSGKHSPVSIAMTDPLYTVTHLTIVDAFGTTIYSKNIPAHQGKNFSSQLNLNNLNANQVASGVYYVILTAHDSQGKLVHFKKYLGIKE